MTTTASNVLTSASTTMCLYRLNGASGTAVLDEGPNSYNLSVCAGDAFNLSGYGMKILDDGEDTCIFVPSATVTSAISGLYTSANSMSPSAFGIEIIFNTRDHFKAPPFGFRTLVAGGFDSSAGWEIRLDASGTTRTPIMFSSLTEGSFPNYNWAGVGLDQSQVTREELDAWSNQWIYAAVCGGGNPASATLFFGILGVDSELITGSYAYTNGKGIQSSASVHPFTIGYRAYYSEGSGAESLIDFVHIMSGQQTYDWFNNRYQALAPSYTYPPSTVPDTICANSATVAQWKFIDTSSTQQDFGPNALHLTQSGFVFPLDGYGKEVWEDGIDLSWGGAPADQGSGDGWTQASDNMQYPSMAFECIINVSSISGQDVNTRYIADAGHSFTAGQFYGWVLRLMPQNQERVINFQANCGPNSTNFSALDLAIASGDLADISAWDNEWVYIGAWISGNPATGAIYAGRLEYEDNLITGSYETLPSNDMLTGGSRDFWLMTKEETAENIGNDNKLNYFHIMSAATGADYFEAKYAELKNISGYMPRLPSAATEYSSNNYHWWPANESNANFTDEGSVGTNISLSSEYLVEFTSASGGAENVISSPVETITYNTAVIGYLAGAGQWVDYGMHFIPQFGGTPTCAEIWLETGLNDPTTALSGDLSAWIVDSSGTMFDGSQVYASGSLDWSSVVHSEGGVGSVNYITLSTASALSAGERYMLIIDTPSQDDPGQSEYVNLMYGTVQNDIKWPTHFTSYYRNYQINNDGIDVTNWTSATVNQAHYIAIHGLTSMPAATGTTTYQQDIWGYSGVNFENATVYRQTPTTHNLKDELTGGNLTGFTVEAIVNIPSAQLNRPTATSATTGIDYFGSVFAWDDVLDFYVSSPSRKRFDTGARTGKEVGFGINFKWGAEEVQFDSKNFSDLRADASLKYDTDHHIAVAVDITNGTVKYWKNKELLKTVQVGVPTGTYLNTSAASFYSVGDAVGGTITDNLDSSAGIYLKFDGDYSDDTGSYTPVNNGANLVASDLPFGSSAATFSSAYIDTTWEITSPTGAISFWFKTASGDLSTSNYFCGQQYWTGIGHTLAAYINTAGICLMAVRGTDNIWYTAESSANMADDQWHHFTGQWNDVSGLEIWLDGEMHQATTSATDHMSVNVSTPMIIGDLNSSTQSLPYFPVQSGAIDDFRIYTGQRLEQSDIATLYAKDDFEIDTTTLLKGSAAHIALWNTPLTQWEEVEITGVTVSPIGADLIATITDPTVQLGSITITGASATVLPGTTDPAIVFGGISISALSASLIAGTTDPSAVLGGMTVSALSASLFPATTDPFTFIGDISYTPNPADLIATVLNPGVLLGSVAVTGLSAGLIAETIDPSVLLNSILVSPSAAQAFLGTTNPSAIEGDITFVPNVADVILATIDPTFIYGGATVTAAPAIVVVQTTDPSILINDLVFSPGSATMVLKTTNPNVHFGDLTVINLQAFVVTQANNPLVRIIIPKGREQRMFLMSRGKPVWQRGVARGLF